MSQKPHFLSTGCPFVTMRHDEITKNHPGGISEMESFEKNARMFKTTCPTGGYSALEVFLTKLNPQRDAIFQYPKRNWCPSDKVLYENRPLGKEQVVLIDERNQCRSRPVPYLHQPFGGSDSDNPVGQRWINTSRDYGNFWPPQ